MGKKRRRPLQVWWLEFTHPEYGDTKVCLRWLHTGQGCYIPKVVSVEFDLFTPYAHQEKMMAMIDAAEMGLRRLEVEEESWRP